MQSSSQSVDSTLKSLTFNGNFSKDIILIFKKRDLIFVIRFNNSQWTHDILITCIGNFVGGNPLYSETYLQSIGNPEDFWGDIASPPAIHWDKPFEKVLDNSNAPFTKWFVGGYLNACYNCVDRHVLAGKAEKVAIIHDSPLTNTIRKVTYQELYDTVSKFKYFFFLLVLILKYFCGQTSRIAGGLQKLGVKKGKYNEQFSKKRIMIKFKIIFNPIKGVKRQRAQEL